MAKYTQSPSSLSNPVECEYDIDFSLFQNDVLLNILCMCNMITKGLNTWTLGVY